jgi:glycosyltransferase involved in cell wall biosynthesis
VKKTRILYVTDSLIAGGIESQLVDLVLRLDSTQFEPFVLCLYGARSGRSPHFAPQLAEAGIPFEVLDIGWGATDKLRAASRIVTTAHRLHPQLIQLEGYHANLLTRAMRPLLGPVQIIGTVRGVETRKQLVYQRLGQWSCNRIVASSSQTARMIVEQASVPEAIVVVIPNAVDVHRFADPPEGMPELRRELAPNGERLLLSVGRISAQKRMHLIPMALGMLKHEGRLPEKVRVCILGQVEDSVSQRQLEEAIAEAGLDDVMIQRPETPTPEAYYHASDVTLLYTVKEGISIAMLESLASGRPVIISEEANAAGIIEHDRTGWIVPTDDLASFAETLETVLSLPEAALRAMGPACVERGQSYSIEALATRYMRLYDSLQSPSRHDR